MKKLAMAATLAAVAVAVPAQAAKPDNPGSQGKAKAAAKAKNGTSAKGKRCEPRSVAYVAHGDFVSAELTQTQGAETADATRDDRWSGTLVVAVTRANKHGRADKGTTRTFTMTDVKVRLADRNGDGIRDLPVAGDRTRVQGKITRLNRKCDAEGFAAETKIRSVGFHNPKSAETPAPNPAPAP